MNEKQGMRLSLILHVVVLVIMVGATLLGGCKEQLRPDHVFEMVQMPNLSTLTPQPDVQPRPEEPMPRLKQPQFVPVPDPPPPAPEPQPKPSPQPKAQPKPSPSPQPTPQPKKISYQEFQPKIKPDTPPEPKPRTQFKVPQLDTSSLERSLKEDIESIKLNLPANTALSAAQKSELANFGNQLRARLERVWKKTGVGSAVVAVRVAADGTLSARILRSSGDSLFDKSVLNAVKAVGKMSPPPGGGSVSFDIPFTVDQR